MGTDLYWDKTYWEHQKEAFRVQVGWAKKFGLPIVIHCRESIEATISLVQELKDDRLSGVFHCFTGCVEEAKKIEALEFYIGLGGVATFKNSGMDEVVPEIDLKHIVLETDSPYLAPVPHRGKRNEPAYIPDIAKKIATYHQLDLDQIAQQTTANSLALFNMS
ncbi:MAG: TatD family hydrolase, partial [Fulvivirga sp.]|nr:TatD family hydrolase [Fulvivirga sp.]